MNFVLYYSVCGLFCFLMMLCDLKFYTKYDRSSVRLSSSDVLSFKIIFL